MNLDFHYYGTYLAACIAGYSRQQAEQIAYAAELTDDNTKQTFLSNADFEQIPTSRETSEIVAEAASFLIAYGLEDERRAQEIWGCFHFLPGNLDDRIRYQGKTSKLGWNFYRDSEAKFKQMCLPNGSLVEEMVNHLVSLDPDMEEIGLKMHVLADTWAHAYFAGIPEWALNDVRQSEGLYEWDRGNWCGIQGEVSSANDPGTHTYQIVKGSSMRYVSPLYLGHGQLGSIPDFGYLRYKYLPVWKESLSGDSRFIEKNNQESFKKAFRQMVAALAAIREHKNFQCGCEANALDNKMETMIDQVLSTRKTDQSEEWISAIKDIAGHSPKPYVRKSWSEECKNAQNQTLTNYYRFQKAAKQHRNWVLSKVGLIGN